MTINSCEPCECIPQYVDAEWFHQTSLVILCQILTAIEDGGGVADNVNIASYGGTATTLGQKLMAASMPVVLASDQSNLPSNITQVGGAALALGQGLMAASIPVTLASNQSNVPANITQIGGVALAFGQGLMAASIPVTLASNQSALSTNIASYGGTATTLGQKVMASSIPVTLSSDQSSLPVTATFAANSQVQITDTNSNEQLNIPISSGTGGAFGHGGIFAMQRITTKTITSAGSTTTSLNSTAHGAIIGNIIQIISGAASPSWSYVSAVPDANTITLGFPLPSAPANGVSFIVAQQTPVSSFGGTASTDNGSGLCVAMSSLGGALAGNGFALGLEDSAHMGDGTTGVKILFKRQDVPTSSVNADADCQFPISNTLGALWIRPQIATVLSAGGSASSSGNNTIVAAGTNRLKVSAFSLSTASNTAVTCIFQSGASGTELWRVSLQAGATGPGDNHSLAVPVPAWLFATGTATLLNLNLSGAIAVNWSVTYCDEA